MNLGKIVLTLLAGLLLASCNSTETALDVEAGRTASDPAVTVNPGGAAPAASTAPAAAPPTAPLSPAQQLAAISATRMQFAPIIGAPVEQVTPLSRRLTVKAKEKNLTIYPASEKNVTHVLKGYFSLLNESGQLKVVYVFDVLDGSGNRLHRIQGLQSTPSSSASASWESVPAALMETIADQTIDGFIAWRGASGA